MTSADEPVTPPSPTLRPHGDMAARYDVVVVGSGYGGAIAASRLARAGRSVCVLERGREIPAGDFPDVGLGCGQLQVRAGPAGSAAPPGCSTCGQGTTSASSSGAPSAGPRSSTPASPCARSRGCTTSGGLPSCGARTSALSSSPLLRPGRAHARLDAVPRRVGRADQARRAAAGSRRHRPITRPPINVTFADGPNAAGIEQRACNQCGDCVTGCNHRAKNTVTENYLPDAAHGAHIFCEVSVRTVERSPRAPTHRGP